MARDRGPFDPFEAWRTWLDRSERQLNELFGELTSSPSFGRAQSRAMETMLVLQKNLNEASQRYFTTLNLPTRSDVVGLGERLTEVENRLAGIEAALASLAGGRSATADRPRPRRSKKPPAATEAAAETATPPPAKKATQRKPAKKKAKKKTKKTKSGTKTSKKKKAKTKTAKKKTSRTRRAKSSGGAA